MPRVRRQPFHDEHEQVVVLLLGLDGIDRDVLASHVERQRREGIKSWLVWARDPGVDLLLDVLTDEECLNVQAFYPVEENGPTIPMLCDRASVAIIGPACTYREARKVRRYSWSEGLPIVDLTEGEHEAAGGQVPSV